MKNALKFSPLQGNFAKDSLGLKETGNFDTIMYYHNGKVYDKSRVMDIFFNIFFN